MLGQRQQAAIPYASSATWVKTWKGSPQCSALLMYPRCRMCSVLATLHNIIKC